MRLRQAIVAIACASALGAHAHGDEHAGPKPKYDYAKAEETAFGKAADPAKARRTVRASTSATNAANSSRSPSDHSDGPRMTACVCAVWGFPRAEAYTGACAPRREDGIRRPREPTHRASETRSDHPVRRY